MIVGMKNNQSEFNGETRRSIRQSLQLCLVPLLMVAWAGCKQDAKVAAEINPVGTYALVSINGNKVPYIMEHEGQTATIKSGTFIINPDGTCSSIMNFSLPSGGDSSREVKATYTCQGTNLTMQWQGAGTTIGTVQGNTFRMENEGMVLAYSK
jgi:hypothetical protein